MIGALVAVGPVSLVLAVVSLGSNALGLFEGLAADKNRQQAGTVDGEARRLYREASESEKIHAQPNGTLYVEDGFFQSSKVARV